ncbi:MAG: hypothetical protein KDK53_24295 [Maritimibacter sp.]|nr:hypothetical protein [Maritimibacter sp.]
MFRTLAKAVVIGAAALSFAPPVFAGDQPNLLIMGEDADLDTVKKDSRIFNRVLREIMTEIEAYGFQVYDETTVVMPFTDPNRVMRDDSELVAVASRVKTPPIDVLTIFQIYASIDDHALADIKDLRVRVSGRMLHVATGKSLGNYEVSYAPGELAPLPANCDRECVLETVGDEAKRIGADVGAVLAMKLDKVSPAGSADGGGTVIVQPAPDGGSAAVGATCTGLTTAYELAFRGFDAAELTQIEEYLVSFKGYDRHRMLHADAAQTDYWYETCSDEAKLGRNLRLLPEFMGVDARLEKTGNTFAVEKIRDPIKR